MEVDQDRVSGVRTCRSGATWRRRRPSRRRSPDRLAVPRCNAPRAQPRRRPPHCHCPSRPPPCRRRVRRPPTAMVRSARHSRPRTSAAALAARRRRLPLPSPSRPPPPRPHREPFRPRRPLLSATLLWPPTRCSPVRRRSSTDRSVRWRRRARSVRHRCAECRVIVQRAENLIIIKNTCQFAQSENSPIVFASSANKRTFTERFQTNQT